MSKKHRSSNHMDWTPVVAFYFRVSFQRGVQGSVSFSEVKGLDMKMVFDKNGYPTERTHSDLVLVRAMEALPDDLSKWIKKCTDFNGFIQACDITISLMNEKGAVVAVWHCTHAYPKEWSISPLDAKEGKLVIETLTFKYNDLQRKK